MTVSYHSGSGLRPAIDSGSRMFSSAVRVGMRLKAWKTKPMRSRRSSVRSLSLRPPISVSPTKTCPAVGASSPAAQCIRVDLPDPDGPMTAVNRPFSNAMSTPPSATTRASPCP